MLACPPRLRLIIVCLRPPVRPGCRVYWWWKPSFVYGGSGWGCWILLASHKALEEAAEWFFRQDGRSLPENERAYFEAWLAIPENRSAYAEIGRTWHET